MSARVLVVDDVAANVKLLEAKLSSEYFDVLSAYSGRTALQIADSELPDVILLDVMMPRMDGFEVCRRLKANPRTADVPVVMVTALSDVANRLRGLEVGADDFLTKPVNDIALFARVRSLARLKRMMEEWRLREEICGRFAGRDIAATEDARPAMILIVEEDHFAAARMAETLRSAGHSVTCAAGGDDAQMLLDGDTELIIVSLSMPSCDPLRLVSRCRANEAFRQLPILLIAEDIDLIRVAKGLVDLGANDYLIRPVDRNELLARTGTQIRRKRLQDRLQQNYQRGLSLALTDPLTSLYVRRYGEAHLSELMERINQNVTSAAVLLFDVDHFKRVNDGHGHLTGDDVLRGLASELRQQVRETDVVGRFGGEEFVVLLPRTDEAEACRIAERLRRSAGVVSVLAGETPVGVTVSVGVATSEAASRHRDGGPRDADVFDLLTAADLALYRAKSDGRNRVRVFEQPSSPEDKPRQDAEPPASRI